jgi:hypothetical protein
MPRSRSDPISEEAVLIDFYFFQCRIARFRQPNNVLQTPRRGIRLFFGAGQNVFVAFLGLSFDPSPAVLDRMRAAIV